MFDSETCFGKISNKPLKSYISEEEANEACIYAKNRYNNEQIPYICPKCGYYHLSPKELQTHNHNSECLDSKGYPKQAYPTEEDALKRAQIIFNERGIKLYVYKCRNCGEYHLTHTPQVCEQFTLDEIFI